MKEKTPPSFSKNFVAGGLAGTIGAALTCPLEVVKTRLQSSLYQKEIVRGNIVSYTTRHIFGVVEALVTIKRTEGIRALWKGLGPNLIGVVPARSIYFSVYTKGKHFYTSLIGKENSLVHTISAATAGTTTAVFTNPIWLIKTRMQLQSESAGVLYKNSLDCFKKVVKTEGVKGLYRGFTASLLGLTESTLQFVTYEFFKGRVSKEKKPTWIDTTVIASSSKLFAAILTYPHEVVFID
jgi:solute carrier family 25, member 33/36